MPELFENEIRKRHPIISILNHSVFFRLKTFSIPFYFACLIVLVLSSTVFSSEEKDVDAALKTALQSWRKSDALAVEISQKFADGELDNLSHLELRDKKIKLDDAAETAFAGALKKHPQNVLLLGEYGRFLYSRKRYVEAWTKLYLAWHSTEFKEVEPQKKSELLRALGAIWERQGKFAKAIHAYREALTVSNEVRNVISLASCWCAAGQPEKADALLANWTHNFNKVDLLVSDSTMRAWIWYTAAYTREILGKIHSAKELYGKAEVLAKEINDQELMDEAVRGAKRMEIEIKKLKPEEKDSLLRASVLFDMALSELNRIPGAQLKKALQKYFDAKNREEEEKALEDPHLAPMQKSIELLQEAISLRPRWAAAHFLTGRTFMQLGRANDSLGHLEAAHVYDPYNLAIKTSLAGALFHGGEWERAQVIYNEIAQLSPEFGPGHWGVAQTSVRLHRTVKECELAIDAAGRAGRCGMETAQVLRLRSQARTLLDRLSRGEKVPPEPRKRIFAIREDVEVKKEPKQREVDPWKGTILDF